MFKLFLSALVAIGLVAILTFVGETDRVESEGNSLDALVIDFYPLPEGKLPLKKIMKHRIKVTNSGSTALHIEFSTEVIAPYPMVIETITPEPSFLWLDPGQSEYILTKMDEKWGEIPAFLPWETNELGDYERTYRWTFTDLTTNATKILDIIIPYEIVETKKTVLEQPGKGSFNVQVDTPLRGDGVSGPISFEGIVVNELGEPLPGMEVILSNGNWSTTIPEIESDGSFKFENLPIRDDWVIIAQRPSSELVSLQNFNASWNDTRQPRALQFVNEETNRISLEVQYPKAKGEYTLSKFYEPDVGYWRGDTDDSGSTIVLINGMENWSFEYPQQETKSLVSLYSIDGDLIWTYSMGWEGWGVSLSRDANYVAFTTSNCSGKAGRSVPEGKCGKFGVLDATDGSEVWTKAAEEVTETTHPKLGSKEVKISNTNEFLAVGGAEGTFLLYDLMTGQLLWTSFLRGQIRGILFDETDKYIYAGSGDGYTYKLAASDGSVIWKTYNGSWPYLGAFKFSKQLDLLGVGGKYGDLAIIDTDTGDLVWYKDMDDIVSWLDFSPDGKFLVAGGGGQYALTLFEVRTGKKIWHVPFYSGSGMFTSDGNYILAGETLLDLSGREVGNFTLTTPGCRPGCEGLFTFISDDMTKVVLTRRDMDPGAIGLYFWQGSLLPDNPGIVQSEDEIFDPEFQLDEPKPKFDEPKPKFDEPEFEFDDREPRFDEPEFEFEQGEPARNELEQAPFGTDDPKLLACLSAALGTERFEEISKGVGQPNQREREAMGFCYQEPNETPKRKPRSEPTPVLAQAGESETTPVPTQPSMPLPTSTPVTVASAPSLGSTGGGCNAPNNPAGTVNAAWVLLGLAMPSLALRNRLRRQKKQHDVKQISRSPKNSGD